jgi:hypothetical protein
LQQSLAEGHALHLVSQLPPIVRLQFRVLDALSGPVLVQTRDLELRGLEVDYLVTDALLDEDAARMLIDDGLFVLHDISKVLEM